jgi:hypothetical protein
MRKIIFIEISIYRTAPTAERLIADGQFWYAACPCDLSSQQ